MSTQPTLDEIDLEILRTLQENARTANAEIARRVGMAPSAILERVRKLEERGVIRGYAPVIDPHPLELGLTAFVFVRTSDRVGELTSAEALAALPEVLELHHIAGEDCLLAKLKARDTESLGRLLREKLGAIPTITSTRTTIVLETIKETTALPLPEPIREEALSV